MEEINYIIFIILGGYLFLFIFHGSRYYHQRLDRQKVIYNSIIAGSCIAVPIFYLRDFLPNCLINWMWHAIPIEPEFLNEFKFFGRSFICMPLGIILASLCNFFFGWNWKICKSHWSTVPMLRGTTLKFGDDFEQLYWDTHNEESLQNRLVCVTLKNGKVYIGWFKELSKPLGNSHISIFIAISGYRKKETKELKIMTGYLTAYENYHENIGKEYQKVELRNFLEIRILKKEILTMKRFYLGFFEDRNDNSDTDDN